MQNSKTQSAVAALGAAILMGGCALLEPTAESYVPPPVGTTWERVTTDTGSYGSGSSKSVGLRGERTWQGAPVMTYEIASGTVFTRPDGAWIGIFKGDTPVITWDPPLNWQYPLKVGKSWTREPRMTIHAAKRTIPYKEEQKVEAYEDVTVPAGPFYSGAIAPPVGWTYTYNWTGPTRFTLLGTSPNDLPGGNVSFP